MPTLDVYARLSKAVNGETIQVDVQVDLCTEKILARGARVGEIFKDNSLSAWHLLGERRVLAHLEGAVGVASPVPAWHTAKTGSRC